MLWKPRWFSCGMGFWTKNLGIKCKNAMFLTCTTNLGKRVPIIGMHGIKHGERTCGHSWV